MKLVVDGRSKDDEQEQAFKGKKLLFRGNDVHTRIIFSCHETSSGEFECERSPHCVPSRYAVFSIQKASYSDPFVSHDMA